ncbi:MAG: carbon storage regulator CsrA [Vampirovibrionales bacterium]|nr:carbon storage regulator CsrA [Vampirovibrionales bacterium]
MLVLSRKTGQKLIIDNQIEIVILETRGEAVKIGIVAPKSVTVYREEIYEEIKKANAQAVADTKNTQADDLTQALNLIPAEFKQKRDEATS